MPKIAVPSGVDLFPADSASIDFTDDLEFSRLDTAIERSLNYYDGRGRNNVFRLAGKYFTSRQMKESLLSFREIIKDDTDPDEKKKKIRQVFDVYRAAGQDGSGNVLFTGYYEPMLEGSLTPSEQYKYPLYMPPPDLVAQKNSRSVSYYSRREIDVGKVLQGKGLELIWVADPVDLFFLHIQGSGKIKLEGEKMVTVSTTMTNGKPFRSITRNMLDHGVISSRDASYHNIKRFLKGKSEKDLYDILSFNERYVFFRFVEKDPIGSLGEPVTPGRTIATDPAVFPEGALAFIRIYRSTSERNGKGTPGSRFVLNQDKGDAIRGPGRADFFCGFGEDAEAVAASLKEKGELYFLIKK